MNRINSILGAITVCLLICSTVSATLEVREYDEPEINEQIIIDGHRTGLIIPQHIVEMEFEVAALETKTALPDSFDWRDYIDMSVGDQGECGSCYAFTINAATEGHIQVAGGDSCDISEKTAIECIWEALNFPGFYGGCNGGWSHWVINLYTQEGCVLEEDDPYVPYDSSCNSSTTPFGRVTDWYALSGYETPDVDMIKSYVLEYGPVFTTVDGRCMTIYSGGIITDHGLTQPNHGVTIIGWNDTDNCWICKNSWGTDWGESGYFRMEYGANIIGAFSSVVSGFEEYSEDVQTLYYDEAGFQAIAGYDQNTSAWCLCDFPINDERVIAIEFWTADVTNDVDLYLYDGFNGTHFGNLLYSDEDLLFGEPGYHSVDVTGTITSGTGSAVVVAYINQSEAYPIVFDSEGTIEVNKTYVSPNGTDGSWEALTIGDVALRLRVQAQQSMMCGDVDGNGGISVNDVIETYLLAVDPTYQVVNEWGADADGNGVISVNDVIEIYKTAVDPAHPLNCREVNT